VRDLAGDVAASAGRNGVEIRLDLEPVAVAASQAAPLALVVNELLGNAVKHGFPGDRTGSVLIAIHRREGEFDLSVADDGVGMGEGPIALDGFGGVIVQLLCQQLRAKMRIEDAQPGVRVVVTLPVNAVTSP